MRTIAYIGNFGPQYSTENDVKSAFEAIGHTVIALQENAVTIDDVREAMRKADMLLITGTWDSLPLAEMLDVLHDCAKQQKPSATLHLDTFWQTGRGGRKWWREVMFHTSYLFTADGDWQREWELLGKNHIWLPPAVRHTAAHKGNYRQEYACDVAFIGSNGRGYHEDVWPYRRQLVDYLRELCKSNGWTFKNPGGDDPKVERSDLLNDFYASASITIGDSLCTKKEDSRYWSDRVPEALGRGGRLIMPQIDILNELYNDQLPMYQWGDFTHLKTLIHYYLENKNAPKVRKQYDTLHNLTKREHTYINRARTILSVVGL